MATYRQPCVHCGSLVGRDSRLCQVCGSRNPFVYRCPACLKAVARPDAVCGGCGRSLTVACPFCRAAAFAGKEQCDSCGHSLMVLCQNRRCRRLQFFENAICTVCGKPIKNAAKQIRSRTGGP
ncbi:MAG: zinc ribbon domain-containing protein [Bifidobacteriaceae bacterium]|nr:zinc ribbon domain-containing protein [Bifidobacteriaceae bacterium]